MTFDVFEKQFYTDYPLIDALDILTRAQFCILPPVPPILFFLRVQILVTFKILRSSRLLALSLPCLQRSFFLVPKVGFVLLVSIWFGGCRATVAPLMILGACLRWGREGGGGNKPKICPDRWGWGRGRGENIYCMLAPDVSISPYMGNYGPGRPAAGEHHTCASHVLASSHVLTLYETYHKEKK